MQNETRQFSWFKEGAAYFLIAAILVLAHADWRELAQGSLSDPDSYMRIVWLEDMLEQREALHRVLRDGSGEGTVIHWSHLLTSVIYALSLPLTLFMSLHSAIYVVAVIFGPITVGLAGLLAAWSFAPITKVQWRWLAAVAVGVAAPIVNYGSPGIADHHILIACVALALGGCAGRLLAGRSSAAPPLGALCGFGVWISPEVLPFIAMSLGACVLLWICEEGAKQAQAGKSLVTASGVFLAVVFAGLLLDPPMGGFWATDTDRLSVVYLMFSFSLFFSFCILFGASGLLIRPLSRAVVAFAVLISPLILWACLFPTLTRGFMPFSANDDIRAFFESSQEMDPLVSAGEILCFLTDAVVALIGLAWIAVRSRSIYWAYAVLCAVGIIIMGVLHRRFLIYSGVGSAAMLPLLLDECTRLLSRHSKLLQATARLILVFLTLMPNRLYTAVGADSNETVLDLGNTTGASCNVREFASLLGPYAGQVVMANINDTPALLYHSRILTVGSMYHRGLEASRRLSKAWLSGPSQAVPVDVRATKADFILICKAAGVSPHMPSDALYARLQHGDVPVWMKEEIADARTGFVLYRIEDRERRVPHN